jgi:hypothetical protein
MRIVISRNFEKKLKKYNQNNENWYEFFNHLSTQTYESVQSLNKYGFKQYKGINGNIKVYGLDFDISGSADRIIFTLLNNYSDDNQREFSKRIGYEAKDVLIMHDISKHDDQGKSAKRISEGEFEINDFLPFIEESINLKDLYSIVEGKRISKVLSEDKNLIINDFIMAKQQNPTILDGIAGSGKTEVLKGILTEWHKNNPQDTILFITSSERLINEILREVDVDLSKVEITTLSKLINKTLKFNKSSLSISQFLRYLKSGEMKDFNNSKIVLKLIDKHGEKKVFSEIMAIIFGKLNINGKIFTQGDYINFRDDLALKIDTNEKKALYNIAHHFVKSYEDNYFELSKICGEHIDKITSKYDLLLIDEVQDYSEVQFKFMYTLSKDGEKIFVSGDINQTINPTLFNFANITNLLHKKGKNWSEIDPLISNFRNSSEVTQLINILNEFRNKYLTARKQVNSQNEHNLSHENGKIYVYCGDVDGNNELFKNSNINIIRSDLSTFLPELSLTVHDIKGLEFDYVATVNLISDYNELINQIFSESYKKDKSMHYFFNLFYVAISRAMKNLVIIESKPSKLLDYINKELDRLHILTEVESLDKIKIDEQESLENIYFNAIECIKSEHFKVAKKNLNIILKKVLLYPHAEDLLKLINLCENGSTPKEKADLCFKYGLFDLAAMYYNQTNLAIETAIMHFLNNQLDMFEVTLKTNKLDIIDLLYSTKFPPWVNKLLETNIHNQLEEVYKNRSEISETIEIIKEIQNGTKE